MSAEANLLRDYIFEMRERVAEVSGNTDFDRGYGMGLQFALESLISKAEIFGIVVEDSNSSAD